MTASVRISPEQHLWTLCRCGERVSMPAFAESIHVCQCGRRYTFDTELLVIRAPNGEREDLA